MGVALLLGLVCSALVACRPQAPATARADGATQLVWQRLPVETEPGLGSPPSLTRDDGRKATLRSVAVRGVIVPPVASTQVELVFDEIPMPNEGATFSIDLPPGAALNRFAVHDESGWHDAEPITPEQAAGPLTSVEPAFDDDPHGPRNFSARVLTQPGQQPHLLVEYASTLPAPETPYVVRLAGLPRLDALDVTVRIADQTSPHVYRLTHENFTPDRDFSISADKLGKSSDFQALYAGKYAVARIQPETTRSPDVTFLVDTSASQPVPLPKIADFLIALSKELAHAPSPPFVTVMSFDQDIRPIVVRARAPLSEKQLAPLSALGRLGGTDLMYAVEQLMAQGMPHRQIVMLSDYENTVLPVGSSFNIARSDLARMDSLVADAASKRSLLEKYAAPLGYKPLRPGIIARVDETSAHVAKLLLQPTPSKTSVQVKGASWSSPGESEYGLGEFFPEVGTALWVFAEYEDAAPLRVHVNGNAKPAVPPVNDETLAVLLKRVVGGARLNELLARYPQGHAEPQAAARGISEVARLGTEYGLLSPLSSFVVKAAPNGPKARLLGGRIVDASRTRMVMSTTIAEPEKPAPRDDKCPELIGLVNQSRDEADEGCPPLYVGFAESTLSIFAEVAFAAGSNEPLTKTSPHLDQLVNLLILRPQFAKLRVRSAVEAQAEGVVRYLVKHGIAANRLESGRLLEGELPPRKRTPKCKITGQRVLIEVREMNLGYIDQRVVRKPLQTVAQPGPSRLTDIDRLIRASWTAQPAGTQLSDALTNSERWLAEEPKNPVAYVALGNSLHANRDKERAARVYGSLFDLKVPGAALDTAAALRLQLLAGVTRARREHGGEYASEHRWWQIAMRTFRQQWQDKTDRVEGSRGYAYAALAAGEYADAYGMMFEAASHSAIAAEIELPVFAHVYLHSETHAPASLEGLLPTRCWFPMQGSVLGAVLSWEDRDSEIEVNVTSLKSGFTYDSVLTERTPGATLKWLPLPEDDAAYPIRVSVRAERIGKNGYAFGVLRVLNYTGRGRLYLEQKPFVVTLAGESIPLYEPPILQRP